MARRRRRIEKWLAGSQTPVFVLDTNRFVSWFNSGCEELTGWPAEEVTGWRCDYSSEFEPGTVDALLASLCPPPELDLHPGHPIPIQVACRDGQSLPQTLHVFLSTMHSGNPMGSWASWVPSGRANQKPPPKHPRTSFTPNWPPCVIRCVNDSATIRYWDKDRP